MKAYEDSRKSGAANHSSATNSVSVDYGYSEESLADQELLKGNFSNPEMTL